MIRVAVIFLVGVAISFGLFETGDAIVCAQCSSVNNSACGDPMNMDKLGADAFSECPSAPNGMTTFCRKNYMDVYGDVRIHRGCGHIQHPKYDCYYTADETIKTTVCQCFDDRCNVASILSAVMSLVLVPILLVVVY